MMKAFLVAIMVGGVATSPVQALTYTAQVTSDNLIMRQFPGLESSVNVSAIHIDFTNYYNFTAVYPQPTSSFTETLDPMFTFTNINTNANLSGSVPSYSFDVICPATPGPTYCSGAGSAAAGIDVRASDFSVLLGSQIRFFAAQRPSTFGDKGTTGTTSASITYTYTLLSVPEVATWLQMSIGFGAIGVGLRQRRVRPTIAGAA